MNEYSYPEAAEEDVKRYERSFRKLPPAHKVILLLLSSVFIFLFFNFCVDYYNYSSFVFSGFTFSLPFEV